MESYVKKLMHKPNNTCEGTEELVTIYPRVPLCTENLTSRKCANYVFWELTYYEHLTQLRDMYAEIVLHETPELEYQIYSPDFFKKFSKMLWENSSGEISKYI